MAKLIELRNVYKIYGEGLESEVRALDGVSLDIEKGEFVAVVGQSGSGKSTMMNVLGCLDIPTRGEYFLDGTDVRELTDKELSHIRNKQIGFIFQQYNLIQSLTVLENVELPLIYQGISADDRDYREISVHRGEIEHNAQFDRYRFIVLQKLYKAYKKIYVTEAFARQFRQQRKETHLAAGMSEDEASAQAKQDFNAQYAVQPEVKFGMFAGYDYAPAGQTC